MRLTDLQEDMLLAMRRGRFPLARFELHNDAEEELAMTALDNVWMQDPEDPMELLRQRGAALRALEEHGLIAVDFVPSACVAGDHTVYYRSKAYELLCRTALEASQSVENCLFNLPVLCRGYAELTPRGRRETRRMLARRRMERLG